MAGNLIAISNHASMLGGGEQSFLDLLSNLPDTWNILAVVPGKGELADSLRRNGVETEIATLPSIRPWYALNIISSLKRYFDLLRRYRPGLIYANGSRAALYGGITGRIFKVPIIWHCRIAEPDIYLDPLLCRLNSKIIANSQATAKRFKSRFQRKVKTIYNGIDIEWLRNENIKKPDLIQPDWKVILVVARISRWKRHDLALSAFEKIAPSDPGLHLVCVGAEDQLETDWHEHLMRKSKQSKFFDRIHWLGQVSDIRPWYRSADILLLPSEKEPFGRVLVEAMACSVPVVATRDGGIPEIVREGLDGFLVTPGNADELAEAMLRILKDECLRIQMSEKAWKRAESFGLSTHIENMTDVFEQTVLSFRNQ